jgi:hypothetical protein
MSTPVFYTLNKKLKTGGVTQKRMMKKI